MKAHVIIRHISFMFRQLFPEDAFFCYYTFSGRYFFGLGRFFLGGS